jgi:hypothetical protein
MVKCSLSEGKEAHVQEALTKEEGREESHLPMRITQQKDGDG